MTQAEIRNAVLRALARIAPEIEPGTIRGDVPLRDQVDIDSMDFLNLMVALNKDLGVDVPASDYPRLATLDSAVSYLAARM